MEGLRTNVHQCVECGKRSPPADTNYTLISKQHGWRLSRDVGADGRKVASWRCPSCWATHRDHARAAARSAHQSVPPQSPATKPFTAVRQPTARARPSAPPPGR